MDVSNNITFDHFIIFYVFNKELLQTFMLACLFLFNSSVLLYIRKLQQKINTGLFIPLDDSEIFKKLCWHISPHPLMIALLNHLTLFITFWQRSISGTYVRFFFPFKNPFFKIKKWHVIYNLSLSLPLYCSYFKVRQINISKIYVSTFVFASRFI